MREFTLPLLLLMTLVSGGAAAADPAPEDAPVAATLGEDGVQRASMVLDNYSYSPRHLIVQAGKPVELALTRASSLVPHNLVIDDPASGLDIDQDVPRGKTITLRFTPMNPGTFAFYCDKEAPFSPSHREKGMEGVLEVR